MKILCVSTVYKKGDNGRERESNNIWKEQKHKFKVFKTALEKNLETHCNFGILIRNSTLLLI